MEELDSAPQPDWEALGWITDRLPTSQDADSDGDVWLPRETGNSAGEGICISYLAVVALGQPWWSPNAANRADEPAPTEPDRIAALEQRVVELKRGEDAVGLLISHLQSRLAKLEGAQADGSAPKWTLDRIAALEQRVVELEATMRQLLHGSRFRLVVEPRS